MKILIQDFWSRIRDLNFLAGCLMIVTLFNRVIDRNLVHLDKHRNITVVVCITDIMQIELLEQNLM